ncbi:transcriptional regulator [Vagococcus elongatus]|uniref:Transcriptional regulator n=2 Tax=Vagococcus elongatus TaxID=180344 RepID=A0A430B422_9ENTE|nr:transcriptional regulator [Vagococcus elongatus]
MSRAERHRKVKKKMSTGKKVGITIASILLLLVVAGAGYAVKVYLDVKGTANEMYEKPTREKSELRDAPVEINKKVPISVLLLGIDTGDLGRDEQGRSDTMMVATLNPEDGETTLLSIPRDTYTEIVGMGQNDKLNHAYAFGGADMAIASMENLLQIPIDYYVSVNMGGLKEVVDAVGGVNVDNTLDFSQDGTDFHTGNIHLNGEEALSFVRMRYEDPEGDYGRQERQRKVVMGIMKKAVSPSILTQYTEILSTLKDNVRTDLNWDQLMTLQKNYRDAFTVIEMDQMKGAGIMLDGISYQEISWEELTRVQTLLQEQLELK